VKRLFGYNLGPHCQRCGYKAGPVDILLGGICGSCADDLRDDYRRLDVSHEEYERLVTCEPVPWDVDGEHIHPDKEKP